MNQSTKQTTIIMNPEIQNCFPSNANSKTAILSSEDLKAFGYLERRKMNFIKVRRGSTCNRNSRNSDSKVRNLHPHSNLIRETIQADITPIKLNFKDGLLVVRHKQKKKVQKLKQLTNDKRFNYLLDNGQVELHF